MSLNFPYDYPDLPKQRIKIIFPHLSGLVNQCLSDLKTGGENGAAFRRWFSNAPDRQRWTKVQSVFTTMTQWLSSKTFNIVSTANLVDAPKGVIGAVKMGGDYMTRSCSGGGTTSTAFGASSHVGSGVRVYLQPEEIKTRSNDEIMLTFVHERCHKIDATIIDFHDNTHDMRQAYNAEWCEHWAVNTPDDAVRNAENYALYCGDLNKRLGWLKPQINGVNVRANFTYSDNTPIV
jgi:Lysine-specific metallo-endopeptidase